VALRVDGAELHEGNLSSLAVKRRNTERSEETPRLVSAFHDRITPEAAAPVAEGLELNLPRE
jgi:hypothetical protein